MNITTTQPDAPNCPAKVPDNLRLAVEPTTLTDSEKSTLNRKLGGALTGTGLLLAGWIHLNLFPSQGSISNLIFGLGALVASAPVFATALSTLLRRDESNFAVAEVGESPLMDQLVSVAMLAAIVTGEYVTATAVPLLLAVGHFLEERSVLGAQTAIEALKGLHETETTRLLLGGGEERISSNLLALNDTIVVRPGERMPVDGTVLEGHSALDQSAVTGESVPEDVAPGSRVFAGTLNTSGLLKVRVESVGDQTTIGKVLETLQEAQRSQAPVTQLLERYANYYLPFLLLTALVALLISRDVSRAVAVIVVGCPCALVLASSTAMVSSLALASRFGILVKNTRFLEVLCDVKTLILDKTGTVTIGQISVVGALAADGFSEAEVRRGAAICAYGSRHPISRALTLDAQNHGLELPDAPELQEFPGQGVAARANGDAYRLGSATWLDVAPELEARISSHVGPVSWVEKNGVTMGAILMADEPRPEAREAIAQLRALGVQKVIILTGDRKNVADAMGEFLGVDEVHAQLMPTDKLDIVSREAAGGEGVLAIGDGVNDAPALARADVGVAMGAMGSDIAIQSADIALMSNDIRRVASAIRLSRQTRRTINVNVALGVTSALVMVVLAFTGEINAIWGAVLHHIGAFAVVFNSARLLNNEEI